MGWLVKRTELMVSGNTPVTGTSQENSLLQASARCIFFSTSNVIFKNGNGESLPDIYI